MRRREDRSDPAKTPLPSGKARKNTGRRKSRADAKEKGRTLFIKSLIREISPKRLLIALLIAAVAVGANFALSPSFAPKVEEGELRVCFIDVGQGDAALLIAPEGTVMIDAGPTDAQYRTAAFAAENTSRIDLMILTHPHEDHIGGAAQVMRTVKTQKVLMPDAVSGSGAFERTLEAIGEYVDEKELAEAGAVYEFGKLRLTVLAPISVGHGDMNDDSIVVRVEYGARSFLFTGDAQQSVEEELLDAYLPDVLDCDVLKVGHHGSASSSSEAFLDAVSPDIAVISVGEGNDYGHPKEQTLRALSDAGVSKIYRTDRDGTVILVCDGETIRP